MDQSDPRLLCMFFCWNQSETVLFQDSPELFPPWPSCSEELWVQDWLSTINSLRSKRFRLVSGQRKTEERDSRFWPREKWNKSQKMKVGGGGGEGRKRLQTNPSILKTCVRQRTQRLIGSVSRTMLTCVDQRFVSYWEDGMVRDTYINFQWLLFILVGKICPPMQEHFLWPLLKRKALLATK